MRDRKQGSKNEGEKIKGRRKCRGKIEIGMETKRKEGNSDQRL